MNVAQANIVQRKREVPTTSRSIDDDTNNNLDKDNNDDNDKDNDDNDKAKTTKT